MSLHPPLLEHDWIGRSAHSGFMSTRPSTTLADLLTPLCVANPPSAVRATLRRQSSDEFDDGVTHRW